MIRAIVLAIALFLPSAALAGEGLPGGNWGLMDTGPGGVATGDIDLGTGGYQLSLKDGTVGDLDLNWTDDPDTGLYLHAANQFSLTAGGGSVLRIKSSEVAFDGTLNLANQYLYSSTGIAWLGSHGGAGNHALGTGDVGVGGALEVDGYAHLDAGGEVTGADLDIGFNLGIESNDGTTGAFFPDLQYQTPNTTYLATGSAANNIIIGEKSDRSYDFAHAQSTNPTVYIQSATQSATEWVSIAHSQSAGVVATGGGIIDLEPATPGVELPTFEAEDVSTPPVVCGATTVGTVVYVDDTNDSATADVCVCVAVTDSTYDWRSMLIDSAACTEF